MNRIIILVILVAGLLAREAKVKFQAVQYQNQDYLEDTEVYEDEEQNGQNLGQLEQEQNKVNQYVPEQQEDYGQKQENNEQELELELGLRQEQEEEEEDENNEQYQQQNYIYGSTESEEKFTDYSFNDNQQENYQQYNAENYQYNDKNENNDYFGDDQWDYDQQQGQDDQQGCRSNEDCSQYQFCLKKQCVNRCKSVKCGQDYECYKGFCKKKIPYCKIDKQCKIGFRCLGKICQKCGREDCKNCGKWKQCPAGTICKDETCVPVLKVCPTNAVYKVTVVGTPNAKDNRCPMIGSKKKSAAYYFCGVTLQGKRINMIKQCQVFHMKDKVIYYFHQPCHKVPLLCAPDETCLDYYCSKYVCRKDEECPYDWQICRKNRCIDGCKEIDCQSKKCKFSQCDYEQPKDVECSNTKQIACPKYQWVCQGGKCAETCIKTRCPPHHRCVHDQCIPN